MLIRLNFAPSPRHVRENRSVLLFFLLAALLPLLTSMTFGKDYLFKVKHHHVKGSCRGDLVFTDTGIRYQTTHTKDQREWAFEDIRQIQFVSEKQINLLSYEDSRQRLGGDKIFKFNLLDETVPADLVASINARYANPISNRLALTTESSRFEISVKHLHRASGCQGKLIIADEGISFVSSKSGESRHWRYSDLQSIGSAGRYELRLGTYEHGPLQYGDTKEFRFLLKRELDENTYRFAWIRINKLPLWRPPAHGIVGQ